MSHRRKEGREVGYDALPPTEQACARARWASRIADRLSAMDFADEFTAAGESYSELNAEGRAARRRPHRATSK